jgi:putative sugar O-methyltransferase
VTRSLTELKSIYERCLAYARNADSSDHVSEFWAEILAGRQNFPDFNEMLVMRRGFTYPLADRAKVGDEAAERAYAMAAHHVVSRDVPEAFLAATHESAMGCPIAFDFGPYTLSAGGLVNALTAFRIVGWCERLGLSDRPLNILEIGAGYGQMALQLHRHLQIAHYAVCDLPENGFLGAFYLQANLAGDAAYLEPHGLAGAPDSALMFATPSSLDRLEGPYDLILNSYSFQEMSRASVDAYLRHAEQTLADGGVLYSLNAHGKAGIDHPHQYRAGRLRLLSMRSVRRFPWQLFGTVPYELVQRRGGPEPVATQDDHLDAIGLAMQLGLQDELEPVSDAVCTGQTTAEQRAWLSAAATLLGSGDVSGRLSAGRVMIDLGLERETTSYLVGALEFVRGDRSEAERLLFQALEGLGQTAARQRTLLMLACLQHAGGDHRNGERLAADAKALAPHLGPEIDRWKADRDGLIEMLACHLAVPVEGLASRARLWRSRVRGLRLKMAHTTR